MLFNSIEFILFFLPLTLLLFFIPGGKGYYQLAIFILVIASLIFYGWWNPSYLLLLIFSMGFNYFVGYILSQKNQKELNKKLLLTLGVIINLALIGYFKYANFFLDQINYIIGTSWELSKIILPLGISFFTFQQITYLLDAYQGETKEYHFLNYCLFVSFFPQLIAGPIVHHKEILPQFAQRSNFIFTAENLSVGITIFLIGLFKKIIIADGIAKLATPVFQAALDGVDFNFIDAWIGALSYTFQLYFDFSGYSEMAIGASRMFGIKLPVNFYSPYKAINIIDFWRRWHITLSNFLRDYLYIPLGGNRKGEIRRYFNLIITMLLGGLWHGAGWTFIIWGGLHGVYLVINNQWHFLLKKMGINIKTTPWWSKIIGTLITFIAVVFAWVIFRAENFNSALLILEKMSGLDGINLSSSIIVFSKKLLLVFVGLCFWVWFAPNTLEWMVKYEPILDNSILNFSSSQPFSNLIKTKLIWKPQKTLGILFGILAFVLIKSLLNASESEFLYFNF